MSCNNIQFSAHGVVRMIVRDIEIEDVISTVKTGEIIFEYPNDKPYPSRLVLGWVKRFDIAKALHVVVAEDSSNNKCIVITAYWPDDRQWERDYKTKK